MIIVYYRYMCMAAHDSC